MDTIIVLLAVVAIGLVLVGSQMLSALSKVDSDFQKIFAGSETRLKFERKTGKGNWRSKL